MEVTNERGFRVAVVATMEAMQHLGLVAPPPRLIGHGRTTPGMDIIAGKRIPIDRLRWPLDRVCTLHRSNCTPCVLIAMSCN